MAAGARLLCSTLTLLAALLCEPPAADAARGLLAELLARGPSADAKAAALTAPQLEACLTQAMELDRTGTAIDNEIAAIDRLAAEAMFMENQLNAEFSVLGGYDEAGLADFQRRLLRHDELARKFKHDFPVYQARQQAYDQSVAAFDRDCAPSFSRDDLAAAKAKLGIK